MKIKRCNHENWKQQVVFVVVEFINLLCALVSVCTLGFFSVRELYRAALAAQFTEWGREKD